MTTTTDHQVEQLLALLRKEEKEETAARVQPFLTQGQVQKLLSFFTKEKEEEEKRKRRKTSVGFGDKILFLFLQRLEADSLYKLRRVSKQWHNLIFDPHFAISHLSYAASSSSPGSGFLFQSPLYGCYKLAFLYLEGEEVVLRDLQISVPKPIIASCNGLVLFRDYPQLGDYFVANPYGGSKGGEILPLQNYDGNSSSLKRVLGFTYVKETGEYKIVCMMREKYSSYCVMIFTLGSNTWTQVKDADGSNFDGAGYGWQVLFPIMDSNRKPLWVNNFLHSLIYIEEARYEFLFSIDTKNGTFHKNERPFEPDDEEFRFATHGLMNLGGVLALHSTSRHMLVKIWILKDFYKKEWIQLHCFQLEDGISKSRPHFESYLIGNLGNGKILLYQGPRYTADFCYAFDVKTQKVIKTFPLSIAHRYSNLPHVNSLVDLKHLKF